MPFTAHDLRHHAEESYPLLCAYLQRYAQRFLGSMKFDAFELDLVVGHVIEQLVRYGLIGGGDRTPLTALDNLTDAQFMAFLHRSLRNKIIDRWRRRHIQVSTLSELEAPEGADGEENSAQRCGGTDMGTTAFCHAGRDGPGNRFPTRIAQPAQTLHHGAWGCSPSDAGGLAGDRGNGLRRTLALTD